MYLLYFLCSFFQRGVKHTQKSRRRFYRHTAHPAPTRRDGTETFKQASHSSVIRRTTVQKLIYNDNRKRNRKRKRKRKKTQSRLLDLHMSGTKSNCKVQHAPFFRQRFQEQVSILYFLLPRVFGHVSSSLLAMHLRRF